MSNSGNIYSIVFENKRVAESWNTLEKEYPERVSECADFLRKNPEDRTKALGILKKLKGRYRDIIQYDITKNDVRVWYRVERKTKQVIIKYAGHHPDKY